MPIERFEIVDKGIIKNVKCEKVPNLMIIAGPNGVGKSTLLELLRRNIPSTRESNINIKATASKPPLYVGPHRIFVSHELHKLLPIITSRKFRDVLAMESLPAFPPYWGGLPSYLTSGGARGRRFPDFSPSDVKRRIAELDQDFNRALRIIFDKKGEVPKGTLPSDIYGPLRNFVERFLHLKFENVEISGDYYKVYFKNRLGVRVEYNELSSGEQDAIFIAFPFIEKQIEDELARAKGENLPNEDLIFLFDGPEEYLHPRLQRMFLKYLREQIEEANKRGEKLQFIIATHSPTLVNEAKLDELYVMHFPNEVREGNQLMSVTQEEQKFKIIKDFLGDLSLLATGKPLLFLEGPQDVNLLSLLIPNIEEVFFLRDLGGKGRIKNLIRALEEAIPELWYKGFKMFAILDRDREEVKARDKLEIVYLLPVPCIENLLLENIGVIYEALKVLVGRDTLIKKGIESTEALEKLLNEIIHKPEFIEEEIRIRVGRKLILEYGLGNLRISEITADELKQRLITECVDPKISRLITRIKEERRKIDEILRNFSVAIKELNGKLILGGLALEFGVEKDILAREIAKELKIQEKVPKSLTDIIERIKRKTVD